MRLSIQVLGFLLLIQVVLHFVIYSLNGFSDGLSGLGAIFDADMVRLTVGLIAIYVTRK